MATFYKYAERSADSQVNWAEIGKNMTDMLKQEVNVREEKKAAIDEATRRYAEELSNAPQGEHVGAREEALRFADDASQYMLMQERLLKSGLLKPRDYMVARQNIVDGTKKAFSSMKAFQSQYAELMERAKTDKSSALEIQNLEEIQGYGNFRESGFFIDSPTGKVNVGLKDYQDIDGKKVVGLRKGSTRGMQYIDGGIYGRIDKFKPLEALTPIAETLGLEIQSTLDPSTITKLGSIKSVEDLRNRKDIDPVTGQILFDYYSSLKDSVNAVMANPLQKASLLADTLGYRSTTDPEAAAKDPKLILKVIDPNSGRGEYQFSAEQDKVAENWMTQQLLSMVTRKEDIKTTSQISEPRARTEAEMGRADKIKDAENFGENLGIALKSPIEEKRNNAIKYLGQKAGRQVDIEGGKIMVYDLDGQGKSEYDLNTDPDELASALISAFGVDLPEDTILKSAKSTLKGNKTNTSGSVKAIVSEPKPESVQVLIPTSAIEMSSTKAAAAIKDALPANFTSEDLTPGAFQGNQVKITAPNGKTFTINTKLTGERAANAKGELERFIKMNNIVDKKEDGEAAAAGAGQAGGTGNLNASNRKPK